MATKTTKKTTVRYTKGRKGRVVKTVTVQAEPATEPAKPQREPIVFYDYPLEPPVVTPEPPKPQNAADAWDAMKAAGELPAYYEHKTNPYRAEQDKRDELAKIPHQGSSRFPIEELEFDPTRRMAPSTDAVLTNWGTKEPLCPHRRLEGPLPIAWMEHSQHIIKGVCLHCFYPFDTRNPEHLKLYEEDTKNHRRMGHAGQYNAPGNGVGAVYGTELQIFLYNWFPWVYRVQVWLRNKRFQIENWRRNALGN
jgi:hypothetical protein